MSRQKYVWHPVRECWVHPHEVRTVNAARSHLPTPRIITDTVEVTSMLDGKTYTSKAALRQTYRAAGVEEVGNEPMRTGPSEVSTPGGVGADLKAAFEQHT